MVWRIMITHGNSLVKVANQSATKLYVQVSPTTQLPSEPSSAGGNGRFLCCCSSNGLDSYEPGRGLNVFLWGSLSNRQITNIDGARGWNLGNVPIGNDDDGISLVRFAPRYALIPTWEKSSEY